MKSALLAIGGLFGATGASACCVLPLVSVLAGVGGPWLGYFTPLASYQPYFVAASVFFLGFGFFKVYGQKHEACPDGEVCGTQKSRRLVKAALWVGTSLVLLSVVAQQLLPLVLES